MHMILRRKVHIVFVVLLVMAGCNQNEGALPSENPPSFESWEQQHARVKTHSNSTPLTSLNTEKSMQSSNESQIVDMTNTERQRNGLSPLKVNLDLMNQARIKAQDMVNNNYFSHVSPTLGSPFDQIRSANIPFGAAGENIAGNPTAAGAFQAWMNSSGHRANILNKDFEQIGVGVVDGGPYGKMLVQMFIR